MEVECRGKMLTKAEEPPGYVSPEQKGWEPRPEVTTAPLFLKDVGKKSHAADAATYLEPEMRKLSPEKIKKTREVVQRMAERFKKPPKKAEIEPELPKIEDISGSDPDFTGESGTEEYIRGLRGSSVADMVQVKLGVLEQRVLEGKVEPDIFERVNDHQVRELEVPLGSRYCPTHPKVLQRVDKLGRHMGMCDECLSARGKKCGKENFERGVTAPPVTIPLNLPKYAPVKEWLVGQAEENERTLTGQIIMILKMAWRQEI